MAQELDIKHSVRRRLEFIEFSLIWEGRVGRKRLQDQFSISPQQATNDLNAYIDTVPGNMLYDPRKKTYVRAEVFTPKFSEGKSQDYLRQLESYTTGYQSVDEIWIQKTPCVRAAFLPTREVKPNVLQEVLRAIDEQLSFEIRYVSLRSKDIVPRRVTPHALGTDGQRWHMRAFNHTKGRYADFVLTRILEISNFERSEIDGSEDIVWNNIVSLRLQPDPDLETEVRESIANEYQMIDGVLTTEVSQAMLFYYLRQYGFDPRQSTGGAIRNQSSYQLSLCDLEEVECWLERRAN